MSQVVEGTWIHTGGYAGEWVKRIFKKPLFVYNTCRGSSDYITNINTAAGYLAFLVIGESVLIFIPFITGIAQDATGYSNEMKTVS